jgi:DNA polymerase elongation subunit (family B)
LFTTLYGLDIETDTRVNGFDPDVAAVTAVALSTPEDDVVFAGPERHLLRALDRHLRTLPPGVIVTWYGASFDLPFLVERARRCGVSLGLRLRPAVLGPWLPGEHPSAYLATWHRHVHLDAWRLYRALQPDGTPCGLKAVARAAGFDPVELDANELHSFAAATVAAYAASDARLARILGAERWADAAAFVDLPRIA